MAFFSFLFPISIPYDSKYSGNLFFLNTHKKQTIDSEYVMSFRLHASRERHFHGYLSWAKLNDIFEVCDKWNIRRMTVGCAMYTVQKEDIFVLSMNNRWMKSLFNESNTVSESRNLLKYRVSLSLWVYVCVEFDEYTVSLMMHYVEHCTNKISNEELLQTNMMDYRGWIAQTN